MVLPSTAYKEARYFMHLVNIRLHTKDINRRDARYRVAHLWATRNRVAPDRSRQDRSYKYAHSIDIRIMTGAV